MLLSVGINYGFGRAMAFERKESFRKTVMVLACVFNLAVLAFFKYNRLLPWLNLSNIALPLGLSFYTFQALSYIFDVYRRKAPVQTKPADLALYICMFPQLISGPIVRYEQLEPQLSRPAPKLPDITQGIFRFVIGLAKKLLLADNLGAIANLAWALPLAERSTAMAWLGLISYTLQIYFDFSGYSDMAIGLGRMLGFRFPENFQYPYTADSLTDFWRRWHITLGSWFREYVYIPLGGNRVSCLKWLRNLLVVWALTGLWHGANWTFLLWGLYYGVLLSVEKLCKLDKRRIPAVLRHTGCLLAIMAGWILFRSESIAAAGDFFSGLVGAKLWDTNAYLNLHDNWILLLAAVLGCTPLVKSLALRLTGRLPHAVTDLLRAFAVLALLTVCTLYLLNSTSVSFIYFRF